MAKKDTDHTLATAHRAEEALKELVAEGSRISQAAVEKRAELSNGTLNYNVESYSQIKVRIKNFKASTNTPISTNQGSTFSEALTHERTLKEKYRNDKKKYKNLIKKIAQRNLELSRQVYKLQEDIAYLEKRGLADGSTLEFHKKRDGA